MADQHRDTSKDVHHRNATLVWCNDLKGYPLPGHKKNWPNVVKTATKAYQYVQRLDQEIERAGGLV